MPILMLMAKAPWSGMAKTRLVPPYSRHQAAEVAEILLRLSVDLCAQHWAGELVIAGWPDTDHRIFSELEKQYQVTLVDQSKGDLGEKMQCLLATAFERNTAAALSRPSPSGGSSPTRAWSDFSLFTRRRSPGSW